jgi:hypothetical protein
MSMQASPFSYYELNTNYTETIPNKKPFKNQNFNFNKLCIHTITLFKWRCLSRSQTPLYILTKRKLVKKLPKAYPPHGFPNNQKETISHGSPCDCTINHKATISLSAHNINPCTMTTQLTPLNNYLSNCIITSNYTPSYTFMHHKRN